MCVSQSETFAVAHSFASHVYIGLIMKTIDVHAKDVQHAFVIFPIDQRYSKRCIISNFLTFFIAFLLLDLYLFFQLSCTRGVFMRPYGFKPPPQLQCNPLKSNPHTRILYGFAHPRQQHFRAMTGVHLESPIKEEL